MANDNRIDLIARVNVEESAQQIIKEDLSGLQTKINENGGIKIDCSIDTKNFDVLRRQISEFSKGLKIDVDNNDVKTSLIGNIEPVEKNINEVDNKLSDLQSKYTKFFKAIFDDEGIIVAEKNLNVLKERLSELGTVTVKGFYDDDNSNDSLYKIQADIKNANGELRTLNFLLDESGNKFEYIGGSFSDKGVIQRIQDTEKAVSKFKKELATFEQSHTAINSGLTEPLNEVRTMIERLASGETTIEAVQKSMDNLKTTAADIGKSLKATGSSFNIFDNAVNKANNFENTLKELEIEINKLSRSDRKDSLSSDFVQARLGVTQLFDIESASGRNEEWAETYKNVSSLIQTMTNDLKIARKEDAEFQKERSKALKIEEKEIALKEQAIAKESELQEKRRSDYWQGRFDESVKGLTAENEELKKMKQYYEEVEKEMQNFSKTQKSLSSNVDSSLKQITSQIGGSIFKNNNIGIAEMSSYSGVNVDAVINKYRELQNLIRTAETPEQLKAVENELNILKPEFDKIINSSKQFKVELRNASADQTFENRLKKITAQVQSFEQANSKATTSLKQMSDGKTFAQGWEDLKESLNTSNLNADGLKHINEQLATFKAEANSAGLTSSSFFKNMGEQIKGVVAQYVSLYAAINTVKKAIDNVVNLDTAMTNLKKVTDETDETYERFLDDADKQAKELHSTISDIVTQTSEWAKLGYSLDEARQLASSSMIYSNVGEVDNQTAVSDLITSMKAFNIEAENSIELVDKFNILGNNFATDAKSIGEGLRVSASTLATAGNDLEQSLALLTGGTEITQNATEMGNALRVISLRLRGMKGELQELNEDTEGLESISKIQTQILNLTGNQVNIFDANKNFKSTYDILKDIASIYDKLSNTAQADLTEILFGKNRANQGIAILQAFQSGQIEKAYETAVNSAGSAQAEFDKWSESIEAHMNSFKEAWENLSKDLVSSKAIKTGIDIGTKFIDILDLLVSKGTVFKAVISSIAIAKFGSQIYSLAGTVATLVAQLDLAEIAANGLSVALKGMLGIGIPTAIILIAQYLSTLNDEQERYNELAEEQKAKSIEATNTYKSESDTLENITVQYTQILTTTTDINTAKEKLQALQDQLVATYGEEATGIDFVNGKYSEQIGLLRDLNKEKSEEYVRSNTGSYNQAIDYLANADNAVYKDVIKELSNYNLEPIKAYIDLEILNTGDVKQQLIELDKLIENAVDLGITTDSITQIQKIRNELSENIKTADELKSTYEEATNAIKNKNAVPDNVQKAFDIYVEQAKSIGAALTEAYNIGDADSIERLKNMLKIVQTETYKTINGYEELESTADVVFTNIGDKEKYIADAIEFSNKSFSELLTNFKESKQDIDLIEESLQKMANGETISSSDAWKIIEMDTAGILNNIKSINGEYQFSMEELIKLKDTYVGKIQDSIRGTSATLKTQLGVLTTALSDAERQLRNYTVNSQSDIAHYIELRQNVQNYKQLVGDANNLLKQQEILLQEIESHLGNTVNQLEAVVKATEKEIKSVEKQIKNLENQKKAEEENLKQRTKSIDDTIDGLKEEKEQVEKVKEGLEEQLDILEKQKDALEEIIDSYSTAVNAIEDVVNGEIDSLEQQRKALEDNYNSQIENLKAIENQKDKENDLLEKQIAMQQKLNDLEDARRKKTVRTYSAEQGWTYEVDRDAVAKAESEYESAKKAYEEERHKQEFDANIKAIEDERDAALEAFDVEIKAYEEYLTSWKEILEEETKAEEQRTAQQLLGLDWREKIKKKDSQLLKTFSNDLSTYNTQLKNLVNVEIANLKASIEQKNKEVKAIEEQISAQNKLKESIEKESKAITDALDAQIQPLNDYKNTLNETLNNAQNEINEFNGMMWTMRDTVNESINQMNNKVDEFEHKMWEQMNKAKLWTGEFAEKFEEVFGHDWGSGLVNNAIENLRNKFRDMGIQGFANGGTISYTGVAQVHGTPTSAETAFSASQSKSLYNMVKSGDFAHLVAEKAVQGINLSATGGTNNNSKTININGMTIKADNPQQFHSQFMYEIGKYWDVKLTESKVYDI